MNTTFWEKIQQGMKKHSGNSTMNIRIYFTDMG